MIEDLYSKPVLLLRSVSGKAFLFCTTYSLKVSGTFYSKAFARKVLGPRLLLLFQAAAFDKLLTRPDLWRPPLYIKFSDHK